MSMDDASAATVRVAKALGDPTRFLLLSEIAARGEVSCAELTAVAGLAQATVSHHLKVLSDAGLISARRSGQFHYYRALPGALRVHRGAIEGLLRAFRSGARAPSRRRAAGRPRP
jgi:ArsR family transcriptional regulator